MQGYACHSDAHCLAIWSHREMGDWRNMKEAVLIGAGQTGRGFIAPILQANAYHITFIDKNKELIDQLNAEKSYTVTTLVIRRSRFILPAMMPIRRQMRKPWRSWHTQI